MADDALIDGSPHDAVTAGGFDDAPPAGGLPGLLDRGGETTTLAAGAGLELGVSGAVWFVREGRVEVFAQPMADGEPAGPRVFLTAIAAGGALCGVRPTAGATLRLVAVGWEATRLTRLSSRRLAEAVADPAVAGDLADALDIWIVALSGATARLVAPEPRACETLTPRGTLTLASGAAVAAGAGVVWAQPQDGAIRLLDRTTVAGGDGTLLVPVTPASWLMAPEGARLRGFATAAVLMVPGWRLRLEAFHGLVLETLTSHLARRAVAEADRLAARADATARETRRTFARFAGVLLEGAAEPVAVSAEDALWECCSRAAEVLGLRPTPMPDGLRRRRDERPLTVTVAARALALRTRQIALRGVWWRGDMGPLVAFREDDRQPVALIPVAGGGYRLHDPVAGTLAAVDEVSASSLTPMAFGLYRGLPDRDIGLIDLVRFGFRNCGRDLLWAVGVGLLGGLLGLAGPLAIAQAFDSVIPGHERGQLIQVGLALAVIAAVTTALRVTGDMALLRVEGRAAGALQAAVVDRLLRLPGTFFAGMTAGDLASRALMVEAVRRSISGLAVSALLSGLYALSSFVLLWVYEPWAAAVAAGLVALLFAVTLWAGIAQLRAILDGETLSGNLNGLILQIINGIAKLRLAGAEDRAFARWGLQFAEMRRRSVAARRVVNLFTAFVASFEVVALGAVFLAVALAAQARDEPMATGAFLAFVAAFTTLLEAAMRIAQATVQAFAIQPSYKRARPILTTLPEGESGKGDPGRLTGGVEVTNVSFRYTGDGPRVLGGVSLKARPGEFIAVVGPSGCGKSTLVKLLLGFERPEAGGVFYDGQDIRGLDLREVRRQIGVVLQNGRLMPGSLYENIKGATDASVEAAWEAARTAGVADDIRAMPMGMHTILTEGTASLSGGQIQRLLIARAVVGRPPLLLLDEATSALDNLTQRAVTDSLDQLAVTRIVVAHRVSTIIKADRIYVMKGGRVVETGTYRQLMAAGGAFADLVRRQLI